MHDAEPIDDEWCYVDDDAALQPRQVRSLERDDDESPCASWASFGAQRASNPSWRPFYGLPYRRTTLRSRELYDDAVSCASSRRAFGGDASVRLPSRLNACVDELWSRVSSSYAVSSACEEQTPSSCGDYDDELLRFQPCFPLEQLRRGYRGRV